MDFISLEKYIERGLELEQTFYFGMMVGLLAAGVIVFLAMVLIRTRSR